MIAILLYLFSFLLSLGQLERISFFNQQLNIYVHELVLPAIIFLLLLDSEARRKCIETFGKCIIGVIMLLTVCLLYGFWNFSLFQNEVGIAYAVRLLLYIVFIFTLLSSRQNIKKVVLNSVWIFLISTLIFSVIQYFLYPNLRNLFYLGWDAHEYRLFGLFFDTSLAGVIYILLLFWNIEKNRNNYLKIAISALLFIALLLTYSRITYITFIISSFYYFRSKVKIRYLIIGIILFVGVLFLLPRHIGESNNVARIFTVDARIYDIQKGFTLWKKSPILGYGYDRIRYVKNDLVSHSGSAFSSSYITVLVSTGIVGMGGLIFFLLNAFKYLPKQKRIYLVTILVASLFDNIFLVNFILGLLAILLVEQ